MVDEGVKTYLQGKHNGALMISGAWGSGKSYYVKHTLCDKIKEVDFVNHGELSSIEKILDLIKTSDKFLDNKYFPVVISVFGISTIKELESAIIREWMDKISNGVAKNIDKLKDSLVSLFENSKKLKEWYDFSGLLKYTPGVSAVTRNTVIILDDLERYDDKISENELLGFINKLSETLGFKVILIANENHLINDRQKLILFKEKVVEKTLMFHPNTVSVISQILDSESCAQFKNFMLQEDIVGSFDRESAFLQRNPRHLKEIENLRTLIFALNHFRVFFSEFSDYCNDNRVEDEVKQEILKFAWFSILALSIEYKANNISCVDLRNLDKFFYLQPDKLYRSDVNKNDYYSEERATADSDEDEEILKAQRDVRYKKWFYEFYFMSREINLCPIASPGLVNFVVKGAKIDYSKLLDLYYQDKRIFLPKKQDEEEDYIAFFMTHQLEMDNDTALSYLHKILKQMENGTVSEIPMFVNGATILCSYLPALDGISQTMVEDALHSGVEHWLSNHKLNDLDRNRFEAMKMQVSPDVEWVYNDIQRAINTHDGLNVNELKETLLSMFEHDLTGFCKEICPHAFKVQETLNVTYFMKHSILQEVSRSKIELLVENLTIADADALSRVAKNRYSLRKLFDEEKSFWKTISDLLNTIPDTPTPGQILLANSNLKHLDNLLRD